MGGVTQPLIFYQRQNIFSWYQINGSWSIRTQFNSYSSQFVLILVNSYSKFWSIRTHLVNSYSCHGQFVLILVNSYTFWSIRTHTEMSTNLPNWVRIDQNIILDADENELTKIYFHLFCYLPRTFIGKMFYYYYYYYYLLLLSLFVVCLKNTFYFV